MSLRLIVTRNTEGLLGYFRSNIVAILTLIFDCGTLMVHQGCERNQLQLGKKMKIFAFILNICLIASSLHAKWKGTEENEYCQFETAYTLCIEEWDEIAFSYAKELIETYKKQPEIIIYLKVAMCFCKVYEEDLNLSIAYANDVIKNSKEPLALGIAWYRKGWCHYHKNEDQKALIYLKVAAKILENIEREAEKENVSFGEIFYVISKSLSKKIYEKYGEDEKAQNEDKEIKMCTNDWRK